MGSVEGEATASRGSRFPGSPPRLTEPPTALGAQPQGELAALVFLMGKLSRS